MSDVVPRLIEELDREDDAIHILWLLLERSVQPVDGYDYNSSLPDEYRTEFLSEQQVQHSVDRIMADIGTGKLTSHALNCIVGLHPRFTASKLGFIVGLRRANDDAIRNIVTLIQDALLWAQSDQGIEQAIAQYIADKSIVKFLESTRNYPDDEISERVENCFTLLKK